MLLHPSHRTLTACSLPCCRGEGDAIKKHEAAARPQRAVAHPHPVAACRGKGTAIKKQRSSSAAPTRKCPTTNPHSCVACRGKGNDIKKHEAEYEEKFNNPFQVGGSG